MIKKNLFANLLTNYSIITFASFYSLLTIILYTYPLFNFVINNIDDAFSLFGIVIILEVLMAQFLLIFIFIIIISTIENLVKPIAILFLITNSVALYFINTYNVVLDKTMMGNVLNTNTEEAAQLYTFKIIYYVIFLGLLPSLLVAKIKINYEIPKIKRSSYIFLPLILFLGFLYLNSKTWLWIDNNLKLLGALNMPFSYSINSLRNILPNFNDNNGVIPLPSSNFKDNNKVLVVLVIGESARSNNFSLYGYEKNTNPKLSSIKNLFAMPNSTSCATYTTEGIKCILSPREVKNPEVLPNYLSRLGVNVIWRSANSGEPPLVVNLKQKKSDIKKSCGNNCINSNYDEILLYGLNDIIKNSLDNNTLIILHQSGSHGPAYYNKYPKEFENFKPVCSSVEIQNCKSTELYNAYDNTIVYTDYILFKIIKELQSFPQIPSIMIYISDHGESLGEYNTYLHGLPYNIAPNVQKQIPFIVWMSDKFIYMNNINPNKFIKQNAYSQANVFYSIMGAFKLDSSFYNNKLDIFNNE